MNVINFNIILRRLVVWIRSSLLLKDTKNINIYTNMDAIMFRTLSHMIIMTQKVDPSTEKETGTLIK